MFIWDLFDVFGWVSDATAGWSWEAVERGLYGWVAESALMSLELLFITLSERTSPQVDSSWFRLGVALPVYRTSLWIGSIAGAVQGCRMLVAGRPELLLGSLWRVVQLGLYVGAGTWFIGMAMRAGDALTMALWNHEAGDAVALLLEAYVAEMLNPEGSFVSTLLGMLLGLAVVVGVATSVVVLLVRNIVAYGMAAYGAVVVAVAVEESNKGLVRELVLGILALALGPSVMVFSLATASAAVVGEYSFSSDGDVRLSSMGLVVASLSLAITGFVPGLLYRFLPALGQASGLTGVVASIGRSAMGVAQGVVLGSSLASMASRAVASSGSGSTGGSGSSGGASGDSGAVGGGGSKATTVVAATAPVHAGVSSSGQSPSLAGSVGR